MKPYRQPYLIQRIERAKHKLSPSPELVAKYLANQPRTDDEKQLINGLMPLDYMGSAEFEFGAFGEALRQVANNHADFRRFKLTVTGTPDNSWYKMPGITESTVELFGFAHKDHVLQAKADIILMVADKFAGHTKERVCLREVFGVVESTQYKDGRRLRKSILSLRRSRLTAWFELSNPWMVGSDITQMDAIAELLSVTISA